MQQSAAPKIPPTSEHADQEMEVLPMTEAPPPESVEDQRLAKLVKGALHATGYGALRVVEVTVTTQMVILIGSVPSFYMKQVAQVTALGVPGTHTIQNGLDVVRPDETP